MGTSEVAHGVSLVPCIGANEIELDELVTHIVGDPIMRTRGYVISADGLVDTSTIAHHRYVVLTVEHQSGSGAVACTYYIRIDRRAERHVSTIKIVRSLGVVKSSDRVRSPSDLQA
jgi:hypothetical protein